MSRPVDATARPRPAHFGKAMIAVAWSFFGIRKRADFEADSTRLEPVHVLLAGLVGAALFVAALVLLVRWVVGSGVAA